SHVQPDRRVVRCRPCVAPQRRPGKSDRGARTWARALSRLERPGVVLLRGLAPRIRICPVRAYHRQPGSSAAGRGARPRRQTNGRLFARIGDGARAQEPLTTAATMYGEMDMSFWLEK